MSYISSLNTISLTHTTPDTVTISLITVALIKVHRFLSGVSLYKTLLQKRHTAGIFTPIFEFLLFGREREREKERERERERGSASYVFWGIFVPLYKFNFLVGKE